MLEPLSASIGHHELASKPPLSPLLDHLPRARSTHSVTMALPFAASARAVEPHRLLPERGCSTARCVAASGGKRSVNAAAALDTAVRRPLIDVQQVRSCQSATIRQAWTL